MCNQCSDIRRIHTGKFIWGVFHNGNMMLGFKTSLQADYVRGIMQNSALCECKDEDRCVWEVAQVDRKSTSWES
jgi:hypothetical protein